MQFDGQIGNISEESSISNFKIKELGLYQIFRTYQ
jgi:hypothetical protein